MKRGLSEFYRAVVASQRSAHTAFWRGSRSRENVRKAKSSFEEMSLATNRSSDSKNSCPDEFTLAGSQESSTMARRRPARAVSNVDKREALRDPQQFSDE